MRLADRIAQYRMPFVVRNIEDGRLTHLNGAAEFSRDLLECPMRYVLGDDLVRLCTALAYSKGARTLQCADLLHAPARRVWIEWCDSPWVTELAGYGFKAADRSGGAGRRGALITSSADGRRGLVRTFWSTGAGDADVLAGSMEAYFDFDTADGEEPLPPDAGCLPAISVQDGDAGGADVVQRCIRFRYERSWHEYYARARLSALERSAVAHHALGTIAIDIPVILVFFLLLGCRPGLPRRPLMLERVNRRRHSDGKCLLLDQVEVTAPVFAACRSEGSPRLDGVHQRPRRLHHVRGHLVRRGSQIFWRVPHLRGSVRSGTIQSRTVIWTVDRRQR